ncbi:MAG: HlyD family secretion protein [Edaphobacter sp.]
MLKRSVIVPIVVLSIAAVLFFTIRAHWTSSQSDAAIQKTDDAYIQADQSPLSTRISGRVRRVYVHDYEQVRTGQLLIEIDDTDYQAASNEAVAALEGARAEYQANQTAKGAADASVLTARAGIDQAQAAIGVAEAGIAAAKASSSQAGSQFTRQQALLEHKAATKEQYEEAQAAHENALAALKGREADLARAKAGNTAAESMLTAAQQQRIALNDKDAGLRAQIEARKAGVTVANVNLGYTKIYAPTDGVLGEIQAHQGQLIAPGMQLASLVQNNLWITANYQETQVARMRVGDPVDIHIDALAGHTFKGQVTEIAPASGSQFALLPPDNATGNYTKVVQRVPVHISINPESAVGQLRPGFSAEVVVHISR